MFEELRSLVDEIERNKMELRELRRTGIYNEEYLSKLARDYISQIKNQRDEYYNNRKETLVHKMEGIKKEYAKPLTDAEVSRQLLNLKKMENKVKFMNDAELQEVAQKYINDDIGNFDELNIVGQELRLRGVKAEEQGMPPTSKKLADELKRVMTQRGIDEPYKNDLAFKEASKELEAITTVSGHDDYIYPALGTQDQQVIKISSHFTEFGIGTLADYSHQNIHEKFIRKTELEQLRK